MNVDTLKVLVVEPQKPPYAVEIPNRLDALQGIVGGHLETVYPFPDSVAVVCNETGKLQGLPFNRLLPDRDGRPCDVICGTFFVAGVGAEDFVSLTDEQLKRYTALYNDIQVITVNSPPHKNHSPKEKRDHNHNER